jgi:hypothetical protein
MLASRAFSLTREPLEPGATHKSSTSFLVLRNNRLAVRKAVVASFDPSVAIRVFITSFLVKASTRLVSGFL